MAPDQNLITLGGGCFWCLEAVYQEVRGVTSVVSGYMGGHVDNPSYRQVCNGNTGHAEVVQIHFDPGVVSLTELLQIFFTIHDPTTLNRQGADVGTQYRSAIFYHTEEQKQVATDVMKQIREEGWWPNPLVTDLTPAETFYPAEEYHQNYFRNNPNQGYCQFVVAPKVAKFRKKFAEKMRA